MLVLVYFRFFIRKPANSRGIKDKLCAAQRGQACRFGKPLIPADEGSHFAVGSVVRLKTKISRGEIEFFVVERIVGNMHLAVLTSNLARGVDDNRGVVINACR